MPCAIALLALLGFALMTVGFLAGAPSGVGGALALAGFGVIVLATLVDGYRRGRRGGQ